MAEADETALLRSIDVKMAALVAIHTHRLLLDDPELAKPRPRPIDQILSDVGMRQGEIAAVLGKTPQAVGQILNKAKKS